MYQPLVGLLCTAPKPPSQAVSGSPSQHNPRRNQHNPRRNWCQTLCHVISLGNLVLSCCTTHCAWWGLWSAPPLFRCPGTPGDALLAQPVQGGFALLPHPPEKGPLCSGPVMLLARLTLYKRDRVPYRDVWPRAMAGKVHTGRMALSYCPKGDEPCRRKSSQQRWLSKGHQTAVKTLNIGKELRVTTISRERPGTLMKCNEAKSPGCLFVLRNSVRRCPAERHPELHSQALQLGRNQHFGFLHKVWVSSAPAMSNS